ncbi:hypothetical protein [Candidatus Coxiella mudrowiae]|uniref:Uncharacterized protein n=1 Tax=Candidatus Coxiella mudrowiae TaxID=2054173 RepID=A0ABN4HQ39_9COXI|nr:hypothetical protein [Candidatus Coxiella mudrowiae]AKQ33296.1 hypothetical protein CleRT_03150 [Candidatus Coxiella mudrowiae]
MRQELRARNPLDSMDHLPAVQQERTDEADPQLINLNSLDIGMPETLQSALETYWWSKGLEMKPEVSFRLQKIIKQTIFNYCQRVLQRPRILNSISQGEKEDS